MTGKAIYEPNLTTVGMTQAMIASNCIYDTIKGIREKDPNAKFIFVSSVQRLA